MARNKKIAKYIELVKQIQNTSKTLEKLQRKSIAVFKELSHVERQEYYRLAHKEAVAEEDRKDKAKAEKRAKELQIDGITNSKAE